MRKSITVLFLFAIVALVSSQSQIISSQKTPVQKTSIPKDTLKKTKAIVLQQEIKKDTIAEKMGALVPYKKDAHASYYADKFHGRKTASGVPFDMNKYTAAHKKFPFGTKLRVTNQANGESVIVEVNDRGPFVRTREIDLSKKAFMEIAKNKGAGVMMVTIEVFKN
ncbi:septal ring lytic transglycosylase RlpA family protein [Flavobacterium hiemivividum]|uniref:Probable endolytic peptidoglycan transglycosylase RlpA n=1 Tax=Flavobacterium hiemivividum TaxID=2541734 RepID=A0A4R5D5S8_9FLAO|nr:septal ring lytic transglycosylase RlpA family protein [Flavobacterium hiemivividum]TDE06594.1 septal ring lytic transglycosylase RlpA family protein [Flavobacterium hiemivividum]